MPLSAARGFLLDLDGVTWFGNTLAPGAREFWEYCRQRYIPVAFVSNASAASRAAIQLKLQRLGITGVVEDQIFPATRAAALYVASRRPSPRVFLIGESGLAEELRAVGALLVEDNAEFIVVGVDRSLTYDRLERACDLALAGAEIVTTNADGNYPTDRGLKPAAGPFAAFIALASGRSPVVVGKPEAELLRQALAYLKLAPAEAVMVGDRPEADVVAARRAGTFAVLVGDHVSETLPPDHQPDLLCRDLADLLHRLTAPAGPA